MTRAGKQTEKPPTTERCKKRKKTSVRSGGVLVRGVPGGLGQGGTKSLSARKENRNQSPFAAGGPREKGKSSVWETRGKGGRVAIGESCPRG